MHTENTKLHFDNLFLSDPVEYEQILLYQAGDCLAKTGFEIPDHRQGCDEISYIVAGEAQFYVDGKRYDLCAGDLFFCPYGSIHRIVSTTQDPVRYFYLGYRFIKDHPGFKRWRDVYEAFNVLESPVCHRAFNMNHLFSDLLCEFQQGFSKKDMLIELGIFQIILHAYKYFFAGNNGVAVYEKRVPDRRELVYDIVSYIDNNVLRIKSLTDISSYIGFSYSYTSQIFSAAMHMSLSNYYQKKRFEEAIKLLSSGMSITHTAEILSFDTVHSFSRAFKNRYGVSPQKYIRQSKLPE